MTFPLPLLNAFLNLISALLLLAGWINIRARRTAWHRRCMIAALCCSGVFLGSYLYHHWFHGSTAYAGTGVMRSLYFVILISHTLLAAANVPLVALAVFRAWKGEWVRHRAIVRWTLPVWGYVSVTGVVVYVLLYGTSHLAGGISYLQ